MIIFLQTNREITSCKKSHKHTIYKNFKKIITQGSKEVKNQSMDWIKNSNYFAIIQRNHY